VRSVWSVDQIRAAEAELIAGIGTAALMQRAAYALAVHCGRMLGRAYGSRVVLLVGAGNNGGDALYAGVALLRRGAAVHAVLLAPDRVHPRGVLAFADGGGTVGVAETARRQLDHADLVIDGIVGIGGRGALRAPAEQLVAGLRCPVVAVDVPSGLDADTGHVDGAAVRASATVTFGGLKLGLVVGSGVEHSGALHEVDIGLHLADPVAWVLESVDASALLPVPAPGDDKYSRGVVGIVSGSVAYEGAAVLSVGGALRAKAGMVRYVGTASDGVRARWPEAVVTDVRPAEAGRVQAWVIGPGLGTDEHARGLVAEVLGTDLPVVVDADGLTLVGRAPDLVRGRAAPTVLTPHDREFERIFGPVGDDRIGSVRRAAADIGATVLLKGQATIVGAPDGRAFVNPTGTGWLASAGTGDVLSGLVGALVAAGGDPTDAAAAAAYTHGVAGALAAGSSDPVSTATGAPIIAMDVVAAIPAAIRIIRSGVR